VHHFRAWIYRIAHNEIVEYHRNHKPMLPIEHAHQVSNPDHLPEVSMLELQASQQVTKAIAQLEPDLQQVLVCRFIDQLSHAETVEIMVLKPGHVRVLQHRALNKVREFPNG
jgi:RNA polymerase sigma-70 factor (ECF subfamily)